MSLSKYFKNSDFFQPEDILKTTPPDPLSDPEPQPRQSSTDISINLNENKKESNSDHSSNGHGETPITDGSDEAGNLIEISEVEKKLVEAYETGVQDGLEKGAEDYGSATKSFHTICEQLDSIRETIIANSSRELEEFAIAIAERIVRYSLKDNKNTIIATIEEALQRAVKSEEFYIYIHPDDYDVVAGKSSDLIAGLSGLSNIVVKKDSTVEKGGAKIESDNCTLDATVAGQFDAILEELKKRE